MPECVKVGDVPGLNAFPVSSDDGMNCRKARIGARRIDDRLLEHARVVLPRGVLERVRVEHHLLLPGARETAHAGDAAVLRRQTFGGDRVLTARPDARLGVDDERVIADRVPGRRQQRNAGPDEHVAIHRGDRVRESGSCT